MTSLHKEGHDPAANDAGCAWRCGPGLQVFAAMLEEDRTALCGPRYAHQPDRRASRAAASGEGRCPPEDCGGPHGYVEFLLADADPNHEEHESMRQWAGEDFDPEAFNPATVKFDDRRSAGRSRSSGSSTQVVFFEPPGDLPLPVRAGVIVTRCRTRISDRSSSSALRVTTWLQNLRADQSRPPGEHVAAGSSPWHAARTCGPVPAPEYTPRDPTASVLYAVVREHVETFRAQAARLRDGGGLPRFVDAEFRAFLRCGFLAGGFARFRCRDCTAERLVAFSCKGRGFCPSCGGRRMAERSAHLVDRVLPDVPVRQWVLTLPHRCRYLLAWRHDLCRAVARILHQTIERHLRTWARRHGVPDAHDGGIAVIQRFGGSVNLNVHVHALVLDGVFARTMSGHLRFHAAPVPSATDVAEILATIAPRVQRLLARHGLDDDGAADPVEEAAPLLAGWAAASVEGLEVEGAARRRPRRLGVPREPSATPAPVACHARWEGFDLHAGVRVPAGHRERLERVCRYVLRPPLAAERLTRTAGGDVAVQLRRP